MDCSVGRILGSSERRIVTIGPPGAACTFSLANCINHAEFVALYNEYQIRKVELRFSLDSAQSYTPNTWTTPNNMPSMYIADDPNDATMPADQTVVQQRGDFQQYELRPERAFTVALYPRAATQLFRLPFLLLTVTMQIRV